jgi:hypothetical protein
MTEVSKKELQEIYNFYKDCTEGFVTKDGYAAVPIMGKKSLIVIYNGEQLKQCRNEQSARNFIEKHRKQSKPGTVFVK